MRIIGGKFRGRKLQPPVNLPVRPTTDFAKEGLFNVINNLIDFESILVLDLFTGTGGISFEFISRGAIHVTSVDANPRCIGFLKKSAATFGVTNLLAVKSNVFVFLKHMKGSYNLIFADPPYDLDRVPDIPELVLGSGLLAPQGLFIYEHSSRYQFDHHPNFTQKRIYGSVNFSFFQENDTTDRTIP